MIVIWRAWAFREAAAAHQLQNVSFKMEHVRSPVPFSGGGGFTWCPAGCVPGALQYPVPALGACVPARTLCVLQAGAAWGFVGLLWLGQAWQEGLLDVSRWSRYPWSG